jgi:hypothetical protein
VSAATPADAIGSQITIPGCLLTAAILTSGGTAGSLTILVTGAEGVSSPTAAGVESEDESVAAAEEAGGMAGALLDEVVSGSCTPTRQPVRNRTGKRRAETRKHNDLSRENNARFRFMSFSFCELPLYASRPSDCRSPPAPEPTPQSPIMGSRNGTYPVHGGRTKTRGRTQGSSQRANTRFIAEGEHKVRPYGHPLSLRIGI